MTAATSGLATIDRCARPSSHWSGIDALSPHAATLNGFRG
jgi:hypothetical protein